MSMLVRFLGQGLQKEGKSAGNVLIKSFQNTSFSKFTAFVAWAGLTGIQELREHIEKSKTHISDWDIFVGIDLKGTSKEALEALLEMHINTKIFHTLTSITYHPKIYLFEGKQKSRIIVGSSNLTKRGLFNNVEANIIIDITPPDEKGNQLIKEIKDYFSNFLNGKNTNVQNLTSELIKTLSKQGIIPNEQQRRQQHDKIETEGTTRVELKKLFPTMPIQRSPPHQKQITQARTRNKTPSATLNQSPVQQIPNIWDRKGQLLWEKRNLRASDAQIITSSQTNPTGVLRLSKGASNIDWTTYFRETLFGRFNWTEHHRKGKPPLQQTIVKFRIMINEQDKGEFNLRISHDTHRIANQRNVPTTLHWGDALDIIRTENVLGSTLHLYAPPTEEREPFFIHIKSGTTAINTRLPTRRLIDFT